MTGLIAWFARNGVVANLLMAALIGIGLLMAPEIPTEIFPEISVDLVSVSVGYRGAAPEDVEQAVCVRIEEAIAGLDGIRRVVSIAREGQGLVTIEIEAGRDPREMMERIKTRVDAIQTFPEETDKPVTQEVTNRIQVINVSVAGGANEFALRQTAERVRDELLQIPVIKIVELKNARPYEISIEVSEHALRRSGLTFDDVANAVRGASLDVAGGSLKSSEGEILLRTQGQAYSGREFEELTLMTRADGSRLTVGDVATVKDGFESTDRWTFMDGKPTMFLKVYRTADQNSIDISNAVHDYIRRVEPRLPAGLELIPWADFSKVLEGRINLLLRNGMSGLVLVFVVLALFLRVRLAFWVSIGIPVSFLATLATMRVMDVSINMISLFAFIVVLGIVVDDAIVVGESIVSASEDGAGELDAVIQGTQSVATPVIFGALTTATAFAPLLFLDGYMGKLSWRGGPLRRHPGPGVLAHRVAGCNSAFARRPKRTRNRISWAIARLLRRGLVPPGLLGVSTPLETGIAAYLPAILPELGLRPRYFTVLLAIASLAFTVNLVRDGSVEFVFFPDVESDHVAAAMTLPQETPASKTGQAVEQLTAAAMATLDELEQEEGKRIYRHVLSAVGEQPFSSQAGKNAGDTRATFGNTDEGEVIIELIPSPERTVTANEVARRWRERTPAIPDIEELSFTSDLLEGGGAIDIQFAGGNFDELQQAVAQAKAKLGEIEGVIDIADSSRGGKPEIKLSLTSRADAFGLTLRDLGRQVRQGFYGEEVQRIQRGRDQVRVMLRYPEEDRRSFADLRNMRIRTPDGQQLPFLATAEAAIGRGFSEIRRVDRQRTISITANVDETLANANEVIRYLETSLLPTLTASYPGVTYSLEGEQRTQRETVASLANGLLVALFVIYILLAIPFRSYWQPFIVMSVVPFGFVGAVWGHIALGLSMSIFSLCGMVALAGVVVNDSLVLVSFVNRRREEGSSIRQAAMEAGAVRFRPVWLTSLTTASGLAPLILEREVQAQFLIPMAVSLASGVLFATAITLILVPSIYLILADIGSLFGRPDSAEASELESATK